jgi:hypothetical protein
MISIEDIIIILIIFIIITKIFKIKENFSGSASPQWLTAQSNEAIQNVASLYNNRNPMTADSMNVNGNINVGVGNTSQPGSNISLRGGTGESAFIEFKNNQNATQGKITGHPDGVKVVNDLQVDRNVNINGATTIRGVLNLKGGSINNNNNWQTHFPHEDGYNYIRGDSIFNSNINVLGKLKLKNGNWRQNSNVETVEEGLWGAWKDMKMCPEGKYVCGLQARFESNQGGNGDDTALNGIKMTCCEF